MELPLLARDPNQMSLFYHTAEQQGAFLGPGHPDWRLVGEPHVNLVYSLTPSMMAEAGLAAIATHLGQYVPQGDFPTLLSGPAFLILDSLMFSAFSD